MFVQYQNLSSARGDQSIKSDRREPTLRLNISQLTQIEDPIVL